MVRNHGRGYNPRSIFSTDRMLIQTRMMLQAYHVKLATKVDIVRTHTKTQITLINLEMDRPECDYRQRTDNVRMRFIKVFWCS